MYAKRSNIILGFHGCDQSVRDEVVSKKGIVLKHSENNYDWLGNGVYFWENNYDRALQFAEDLLNHPIKGKSKIQKPSVIGAVIDLGYCLDLLDSKNLELLKQAYQSLKVESDRYGIKLPENKNVSFSSDLLLRYLDCAVIESIHQFNKENLYDEFDSVRGMFIEGSELYPKSGFREKNHIQIAIRNPNCIKGYFIPRKLDEGYQRP